VPRRRSAWLTRICPSLASAQSRDARLHTVPIRGGSRPRSAKPILAQGSRKPWAMPRPKTDRAAALAPFGLQFETMPRASRSPCARRARRDRGRGQGVVEEHHDAVARRKWSRVPSERASRSVPTAGVNNAFNRSSNSSGSAVLGESRVKPRRSPNTTTMSRRWVCSTLSSPRAIISSASCGARKPLQMPPSARILAELGPEPAPPDPGSISASSPA